MSLSGTSRVQHLGLLRRSSSTSFVGSDSGAPSLTVTSQCDKATATSGFSMLRVISYRP